MRWLLRWLHLDPCADGHMPVMAPPLHKDLVGGRCGRCYATLDRCEAGWCIYRDDVCLKCGWPPEPAP